MGTSRSIGSASARRRRPLVAAGAVTLLAVAATACGNGSPPQSASASSSLPPAASSPSSPSVPSAPSVSSSPPASSGGAIPSATSGPPEPAPTGTASATAAGSRCTVTDLRMRLGTPDHGAGSVYYPLRFTNTSGRTCALDGYPGVSLIRGDGSVIGRPADRTPPHGRLVAIAPGKTVEADLHTLNQGVKGDSCWRKPTFLLVYPPGSTASMSLATSSPLVCGDTFEVGAVH